MSAEEKTMPAIEYGDDINTYAIRWHEWAKEALAMIADLRKRPMANERELPPHPKVMVADIGCNEDACLPIAEVYLRSQADPYIAALETAIADIRKKLDEALGMEYRARQSGVAEGMREALKMLDERTKHLMPSDPEAHRAWDIYDAILAAIPKTAGGGE